MKPAAREIARILARPDPATPGFLIYGQDAMRVALARRQLVAALVGPDGEAEMRLVRPEAAELRRATPALSEEMRARGFFPGPRAVLVEDAGDGLADAARLALAEWQPGDAALVMTAGALRPTAALRKLFETHPKAVALPIYDNPPGRDEIAGRYAEQTGVRLEQIHWYEAFALWKTAVVVQQIYLRYVQGQTRDPRFADRGARVPVLAELAREVLDQAGLG